MRIWRLKIKNQVFVRTYLFKSLTCGTGRHPATYTGVTLYTAFHHVTTHYYCTCMAGYSREGEGGEDVGRGARVRRLLILLLPIIHGSAWNIYGVTWSVFGAPSIDGFLLFVHRVNICLFLDSYRNNPPLYHLKH